MNNKETKKINWAAVGVIVALFIGLAGIGFSFKELQSVNTSLQQSQVSLNILANKEGVSLEPIIGVDALMYKNSQLGSPKVFIFNNGKIEAINVVVQIIRREFDGENFVGASWGSGEGGSYVFDEIKTYETKEIVLPEEYIIEPDFNTIELRVHYMREYDKKSYRYRTFFFYGPEERDFKSWYNIKQAQRLKSDPFTKVVDRSLELPIDLYSEGFENVIGSELYEF